MKDRRKFEFDNDDDDDDDNDETVKFFEIVKHVHGSSSASCQLMLYVNRNSKLYTHQKVMQTAVGDNTRRCE